MTGVIRRSIALLLVAVVVIGAACGNEIVQGTSGEAIEQLPPDFVPSELAGMPVTQEDMSATMARANDAFVEAVGLYGMRRDELLHATLQVSRFRENAPMRRPQFRSSLVNQIGGSKVESYRMGSDTIYRTTGRKQTISIWFRDEYLFVLSVRESFKRPRSLLRESLEIEPA